MNEILNEVFEVSGDLELTQELIGVLIDIVESTDIKKQSDAICYAKQQKTIAALLHIALNYVFNAKVSLEKLQD